MANAATDLRSEVKWPAILLILTALSGIALATLSLHRLGFEYLALAWQVNLPRIALVAAAGAAFAVGRVPFLQDKDDRLIQWHILGFVSVMVLVAALVLPNTFDMTAANTALTLVGAVLIITFSIPLVNKKHPLSTILLGSLLIVAIGLSVLNYAGTSMSPSSAGAFGRWLMGDVSAGTASGYILFVLVLGLIVLCCRSKPPAWPRYALTGLAVGAVGPVFFLGCMVPPLVSLTVQRAENRLWLICCALFGAFTLVAVDAGMRLALGGYAPPVGISVALLSAPFALWLIRQRLLQQRPSKIRGVIESALILMLGILEVVALYHIIAYANLAT